MRTYGAGFLAHEDVAVKVKAHATKTDVHEGRATKWHRLCHNSDSYLKNGSRRSQTANACFACKWVSIQVLGPTGCAMGIGGARHSSAQRVARHWASSAPQSIARMSRESPQGRRPRSQQQGWRQNPTTTSRPCFLGSLIRWVLLVLLVLLVVGSCRSFGSLCPLGPWSLGCSFWGVLGRCVCVLVSVGVCGLVGVGCGGGGVPCRRSSLLVISFVSGSRQAPSVNSKRSVPLSSAQRDVCQLRFILAPPMEARCQQFGLKWSIFW